MKAICAFTLMFLASALAFGQEESERPRETGPFGLWMGMSKDEFEEACGEVEPVEGETFEWQTYTPPQPHPDWKLYLGRFHDSTGLCNIRIITDFFRSDDHGFEIQSRFREHVSAISQIYKDPKLSEFLLPGSIWSEPRDFVMGIQVGERMMIATWKIEDPSRQSGISEIRLQPVVQQLNVTFLLQYEFENYEECQSAIERDTSRAF